jgi:hypothetical protein
MKFIAEILPDLRRLVVRRLSAPRATTGDVPSCIDDLTLQECLFVISPGRSGTKALIDFCERYTDMYCVHAPKPWLATVGYLYHQGAVGSEAARYSFYTSREEYLRA